MKEYETIAIEKLKPYENNARTHSEDQIEMIVNSINEFGFVSPCVIDENNMILVGHGRVEAAKRAGLAEVPCRRVTHLTDDQKKAYVLADNKLSDLGGWDDNLLQIELQSIDIDMSEFGFELDSGETEKADRKEVDFVETISVVIDCENEEEAEEIFEKLQNEGYECRISTL